jgi:hypothetical protein
MAFKLKITAPYLDFEMEDSYIHVDGYTKHDVPSLDQILSIIEEVASKSISIETERNKQD